MMIIDDVFIIIDIFCERTSTNEYTYEFLFIKYLLKQQPRAHKYTYMNVYIRAQELEYE